jgi:ABC-type oligopeptide transport system ATPase subunit
VSLMKNIFAVEGQSLSKTFLRKGGSQIVLFSHLSVSFKKGEVVGLVGPSGKGKTTLGDILLGLIVPDRGKVLWKGQDIRTLSKTKKKNLRPYFQKIHQDPGSSFPQNRLIRTIFEDFFRWGYHPALSSEKEWWNALGEGSGGFLGHKKEIPPPELFKFLFLYGEEVLFFKKHFSADRKPFSQRSCYSLGYGSLTASRFPHQKEDAFGGNRKRNVTHKGLILFIQD